MSIEVNLKNNKFILVFGAEDQYSGVATYRHALIQVLKERQAEAIYIIEVNSPVETAAVSNVDGITIIKLPPVLHNVSDAYAEMLGKYIHKDFDYVCITNFFPASFIVEGLRKTYRSIQILHVVHDMIWMALCSGDVSRLDNILVDTADDSRHSRLVKASYIDMARTFSSADSIICLCKATATFVKSRFASSNVVVISNGLPDEEKLHEVDDRRYLYQKFGLRPNSRIYLSVGRMSYAKGIDRLPDIFSKIKAKDPDAVLVVTGNADEFASKILGSIEPSLRSHIIVTGALPRKLLFRLYSISDAAIIVSRHEQCSMTGIELMMHGIPVIYMPAHGVTEMFKDGAGVSVEEALGSSDIIATLSSLSPRHIYESKYSFDIFCQNYTHLLRKGK